MNTVNFNTLLPASPPPPKKKLASFQYQTQNLVGDGGGVEAKATTGRSRDRGRNETGNSHKSLGKPEGVQPRSLG